MTTLLCLGFGYCAQHFAGAFGERFERIVGTTRAAERAADLAARRFGGRAVEMIVFDGVVASPELSAALEQAEALLISSPPGDEGDPVLAVLADAIASSRNLRSVVLLSTLGVYGDHQGAWIDETTPCRPVNARSRDRLAQEQAWQALGARAGVPVAVLRLAGIYGPGQNALVSVACGQARRIDKPGQVFNRIHVFDIAQAIAAAFARRATGVFNVADDAPSASGDPIVLAAELLGRAPPATVPFADAAEAMSPMALSFYAECKRARNARLVRELGVTLRYPTYREGLRALFNEGQAAG